MQWVKSHLVLVISGAVGIVSLVMIALGIFLSDVKETLAANQSVYSGLQAVANKPVNQDVLDRVRRQQQDVRRRIDEYLSRAAKVAVHAPLRGGVFPVLKEEVNRIEFPRDHLAKRLYLLQEVLKAGTPPDTQDVQDYQEALDRTRKQEAIDRGEDPNVVGPGVTEAITPDMTPEQRVKVDALAGAAVARAGEIQCYADLNSLDPGSAVTSAHPSQVELWKAQLSLWIQEDMVNVLAKVNEAEAAKVSAAGQKPNVTNLPIKNLLYLAVGNYVPAETAAGGAAPPGASAAAAAVNTPDSGSPPPGTADAVFTARGSTPTVDVVQFAMGLVIDVRSLPALLDEIAKAGFFTPLIVSYDAVPYNASLHEYVYGSAPVIRVRLEYEACMLREKYAEWMPEAVKSGGLSGPASLSGTGGAAPTRQPSYGPPMGGAMER